jgi:dTDP-L-rhamnose 4-epimerase
LPETILVTGGAGFIGSHLVDALLERGHRVRVLDSLEPQVHGGLRERGEAPSYLNPAAEFIAGDIADAEAVSRAMKGVDVVFHQAALVGVAQSMYEIERYTRGNSLATAALLQALVELKARPRKLVVASSMSIYGEGAYHCPIHGTVYPRLRPLEQLQRREWEMRCPMAGCVEPVAPIPTGEDKPLYPTSVYAITKRDHEELCLAIGAAYGIATVALRYFNVYGARQALSNPYTGVAAIFCGRLLNGKAPVIYEDGRQQRDFTHVSDIVQANLLAMDEPRADGVAFNVAAGRPLSILAVAEQLLDYFRSDGLCQTITPEITSQFRAGDIRHCSGDISRLAALGFQPRVRFEDGIAELVEWVRTQQAADAFDSARQALDQRGLTV